MKRLLTGALALSMLGALLTGCGSEPASEEIVITYPTYRVGTQNSAESEAAFIKSFNEKWAGTYRVEVEEIPGDQAYVDKMKVLASTNSLPDVVEGKDGIFELAIENGQAIDLTEMINADPTYKEQVGDKAIAANTVDGKLYAISNQNQLIGYLYNTELFDKAGIKPAETWDEFMSNLEALKQADVTPIAMMTGENQWTTNLLLAAYVGTQGDAGQEFMTTYFPTDYTTPEFVSGVEMIQTVLQDYTSKDAIGAGYATAANHFLSGDVAIITNGPWMSNDILSVDGLYDKVAFAMYPGNACFSNFERGYLVCSEDPEKQQAAFEFIKHKTNLEAQEVWLTDGVTPLTSLVEMTAEQKEADPLMAAHLEKGLKADTTFNTLIQISYANVITEMSKAYTSLAAGDMTPEEFCAYISQAAQKN